MDNNIIKISKEDLLKENNIAGCYFATIYQFQEALKNVYAKDIRDYKEIYSSKLIEAIGDCVILGCDSVKMLVEKENNTIENNLEVVIQEGNSRDLLINAKYRITEDIKSLRSKLGEYKEKKVEELCKEKYIVPAEGDVEKATKIGKIVFLNSAISTIFNYDVMPTDVSVYNLILNKNRN